MYKYRTYPLIRRDHRRRSTKYLDIRRILIVVCLDQATAVGLAEQLFKVFEGMIRAIQ